MSAVHIPRDRNASRKQPGNRKRGGEQVTGRMLAAAIRLFGRFSYEGVTTRRLAKAAATSEGSLYRVFVSIERLYDEAINHVVQGSANSMAEFALKLYKDKGKKTGHSDVMRSAVLRWYFSFSADGARLLQQVILNDKRRRPHAQQAFDHILAILQSNLNQNFNEAAKSCPSKTHSETLIWTLFQLKLSYDGSAKGERQELDRYLENWLLTIPAGGGEELTS